jgi:hypothetical protein
MVVKQCDGVQSETAASVTVVALGYRALHCIPGCCRSDESLYYALPLSRRAMYLANLGSWL